MLALPLIRGFLIGLLAVLSGLSGCDTRDPVARGRINAFDTVIDVTLIGVDRQRAAEITRMLESDLRLMEAAWQATEPGPVSHMNALFNAGSPPFAAPPSVLPLLRFSKTLSERSDDLFNPAIGHLTRAWGFQGREPECLQPAAPEIIDLIVAAQPSMRDITIDGLRVSARKQTVKLDFSRIQKGFAIDQAIARLREFGVQNARIDAAGDLRAIGSRAGHPWSVAIRGPEGGGILATLQISGNEAAFTAGRYERNFTWDGEVYHDIIDPRTGYPAMDTASVTVLHANASTADAAATALFIAGPKDWHRVARKMGIRYVMLTDNEGRIHMNPAMQARVKLQGSNNIVIISEPLA
jgi:thiamine biosynthesis lipoprotein